MCCPIDRDVIDPTKVSMLNLLSQLAIRPAAFYKGGEILLDSINLVILRTSLKFVVL